MAFPRPDAESKVFFQSILPPDPRIRVQPMFGNLAGFVNGNMFTGLFGSEVFVRLPEEARVRLLSEEGASPFEPMPGRPMTEYVVMPVAWRNEPEKAQTWVERSLNWAGGLPEKAAKPKK